jgi:type II secretory pathway predicted ATPase ExeA
VHVNNIHPAFAQLGGRWPLLILEEAQNLSASALEEVRLLTCARSDTAQSRDYVTARLRAVGVHANPFEDQALELLIQAAGGLPRAINHLAQRAIEAAAACATATISATHVQAALDRLPWLNSLAAA